MIFMVVQERAKLTRALNEALPYQREQLTSIMRQFIESKTGFYITKRQANSKEY